MKKILITIIILFVFIGLSANPIRTPWITISEIYFDNHGKWVLELQYYDEQEDMSIDSIWIESKAGISKIRRFNLSGSTGLIVVREDSLLSSLDINPVSDSVQLIYDSKIYNESNIKRESDPVVYGQLINSSLSSPQEGQSIAKIFSSVFSRNGLLTLDKSPTIGTINDTIGVSGTIQGNIYDKNNKLLNNTKIRLDHSETGLRIFPKADGSYSTRVLSKRYHIYSFICYSTDGKFSFTTINPIDVWLRPDSIITVDVHLLDSLTVGVPEISSISESIIKMYPNPVNELLEYEISLPVISSNCYLDLVDMNGRMVGRYDISDNHGIIHLPPNMDEGVYLVKLYANNRNYSSSKIIVSR